MKMIQPINPSQGPKMSSRLNLAKFLADQHIDLKPTIRRMLIM